MRCAACIVLALSLFGIVAEVSAQSSTRRPVRRGDVTGLDLGLEGSLSAPRGGTLRWLVTAWQVVGLRDLRPSPGTEVRVVTSLDPDTAAAEVTTDENGRARVDLPIDQDAPDTFRVVIEANAPVGVSRRYELDVRALPGRTLGMSGDRTQIPPGGTLRIGGRIASANTGRGMARDRIRLTLQDGAGRPLREPVELATDAAGLYAHAFRVPRDVRGPVQVRARVEDGDNGELSALVAAEVVEQRSRNLLVGVMPERVVAGSRESVGVDVVVRTADGRPVEGAVLDVPTERRPNQRQRERRPRTDARGQARFTFRTTHLTRGHQDQQIPVTATREGIGTGQGRAVVRVAATEWSTALAVEGGALPETLGGRLYVRVFAADGSPAAAGVRVHAEGPRLVDGGLDATTDDDGVAVFELELGAVRGADRCGGEAATDVTVRAGAASRNACIPIDPDGAARVRIDPPLVESGGHVRVEVARAPAARRMPVAVSVFQVTGATLRAVSHHVVPPRETTTEITLPEGVVGHVIVRARPVVGRGLEEVRGGVASLWVTSGPRATATARFDPSEGALSMSFGGNTTADRSVWAVALPIEEARALERQLRAATAGPLGQHESLAGAGPSLVAAALAAVTPADLAAPAVLRGRNVVAVPAPSQPEAQGLLRDPFRARARFVEGRLALVLRAIENHVDAAVPERIDDVAVEERGRFRFNEQVLASIASSGGLGEGGATGLGGEAITIDALSRLDRAFVYDNVARRITRRRLFRLLLALREYSRQSNLDLTWSWRGEPATWLRQMPGRHVPSVGAIQRRELVDGWGRPFELRPAAGGRQRFSRIVPLPGWELVSAGPDGRFGSGDDMVDPTARTVPSGSLYAEAVGEDALVARLAGVELGRATVALGARLFSASVGRVPPPTENRVARQSAALWRAPDRIHPDPWALALRRPAHPGDGAGGALTTLPAGGGGIEVELDEEPRTWGAVAIAWTPEGASDVALDIGRGGAPVIVEGDIPRRIRTGEPLRFGLAVTNVTDAEGDWSLTVEGAGLSVDAPPSVAVPAGEARDLELVVSASEPGRPRLALSLRDAQGSVVRRLSRRVAIDRGLHPIRRRASTTLRDGSWEVDLEIPDDARSPRGRIVLMTARGLADDPDLAGVRRADPALVAWAHTLAGRHLDADTAARLLRAQDGNGVVHGAQPALSTACALITWSAGDPEDEDTARARTLATNALGGLPPMDDGDEEAGEVLRDAAVLAAIAVGGVAEPADLEERAVDPVSAYVATLRPRLRGVLRRHPDQPTLMARAAAALLVADSRDGHGRAMLARTLRRTRDRDDGGLVLPALAERASRVESLIGTMALAIAAHQAGRTGVAARLLRGAAAHDHVIVRRGGEAVFWRLAAAAYGVMGVGTPEEAIVAVDGDDVTVSLEKGWAVVELEDLSPGDVRTIEIEAEGSAGVAVRVEAVFGRPFGQTAQGPLSLRLSGDVGREGGVAALELAVSASRRAREPVIDLQLPAGVDATEELLAALASASAVLHAERRNPGFVRIRLRPMRRNGNVVVPLPMRWRSHGRVRGLGVVGYDASRPAAMSVLRPRELAIRRAER